MSYILDSLRRAERERKAASGPELSDLYSPAPPPTVKRRSRSVWIAGMIMLNLLVLAGLAYYLDQRLSRPGSPPVASAPVLGDRVPSSSENKVVTPHSIPKSASAPTTTEGDRDPVSGDNRLPSTIPPAEPATRPSYPGASPMSLPPVGTDLPRAEPSSPESEKVPSVLPAATPAIARQVPDRPQMKTVRPLSDGDGRPEENTDVFDKPTALLGPPQDSRGDSTGATGAGSGLDSPAWKSGSAEVIPDFPHDPSPGNDPPVAADPPAKPDVFGSPPIDGTASSSTTDLDPIQVFDAPPFRELPPGLKKQFGHLALNVLVYFNDPDRCRAYINFHRYRIGDTLPDVGLRVEGILPDGVILNYGDGRFKLQTKR